MMCFTRILTRPWSALGTAVDRRLATPKTTPTHCVLLVHVTNNFFYFVTYLFEYLFIYLYVFIYLFIYLFILACFSSASLVL